MELQNFILSEVSAELNKNIYKNKNKSNSFYGNNEERQVNYSTDIWEDCKKMLLYNMECSLHCGENREHMENGYKKDTNSFVISE